jgi:hypothetical protein
MASVPSSERFGQCFDAKTEQLFSPAGVPSHVSC